MHDYKTEGVQNFYRNYLRKILPIVFRLLLLTKHTLNVPKNLLACFKCSKVLSFFDASQSI